MALNGVVTGENLNISGAVKNLNAIGCRDKDFDSSHSDKTYIENGRVIPNLFANAPDNSGLSTYVTGSENFYKGDCSAGNVSFEVDALAMTGCSFTIKCTGAGYNFLITTKTGTGKFETAITPYTLKPALLSSYTIWSDGKDLFISSTYIAPIAPAELDTTKEEELENLINRMLLDYTEQGIEPKDETLINQLEIAIKTITK